MNVKQWALFFLVTLSVNYVSATFLPIGGSRRRSSYRYCNSRLRGYISTKIEVFRESFVSKYGRQCSLGHRELSKYTLKSITAKGFSSFKLEDRCQYYVDDGQAFIRFAISFEEIVASFYLDITEGAGGILGRLANAIIGIIGGLVNKILQCAFPSFQCDIIVIGNYENGFRLHDFSILKAAGGIGFLGSLSGHADYLGSFSHLLFAPLEFCINLFLTNSFRLFFASEILEWEYDEEVFSSFGLDGLGGVTGGSGFGKGGGITGGSGLGGGGKTGGSGLGGGGLTGGSGQGGDSEGGRGGRRCTCSSGYDDGDDDDDDN